MNSHVVLIMRSSMFNLVVVRGRRILNSLLSVPSSFQVRSLQRLVKLQTERARRTGLLILLPEINYFLQNRQ